MDCIESLPVQPLLQLPVLGLEASNMLRLQKQSGRAMCGGSECKAAWQTAGNAKCNACNSAWQCFSQQMCGGSVCKAWAAGRGAWQPMQLLLGSACKFGCPS
eukprot:537553-Pelagomonas_calceolata.AAC.1